MQTLNLGILAHVDAGKTTLTERLLYAAGVIDALGSVDQGTTQTDSLALEQQRGITIKSAVASFTIDDVTVNLIDTPGHPDFIAEVERALSVLDGVVLVISAVEGVQPQTRILMRALQRLRVPTLIFVNKIDRRGARDAEVLQEISERLTPAVVAMGSVQGLGTRGADFTPAASGDAGFAAQLADVLARRDESIMAAYVSDDHGVSHRRLHDELTVQTHGAFVHPVFFGSAITGAGIDALTSAVVGLLPSADRSAGGPTVGRVFKIERGPAGEKIAYVRMFSGTIRTREQVELPRDKKQRITAIRVFQRGGAIDSPTAVAGDIAKVWGLADSRIGDAIGHAPAPDTKHQFAPPTLETVITPRNPSDRARLRVALDQLAEQDPLIDVRQNDTVQEMTVWLYGEVQKEVIGTTLATDFGIDVSFLGTTTIYVERPIGAGSDLQLLQWDANPYSATLGLRIEPAPAGSGVEFRTDVDQRDLPLHIYKTADSFVEHMTQYIGKALETGLFGWQVTDCTVTMTECGYYASDGPTKPSGGTTRTVAADFRKLTPFVLRRALEQAKTAVCEPMIRARIEAPSESLGAVLAAVARLGGAVEPSSQRGDLAMVESVMPASRLPDLQRQLPGITAGEAAVETSFGGYAPVGGTPPVRRPATPSSVLHDAS
jgi:ribosomal protection tetracycline resistance protein